MFILTKRGLEKTLKKMKIVEVTQQSFNNMTAIGYLLKNAIYVYSNKSKEIRPIEVSTEIMVQKLIIGWRVWAVVEKGKYYYIKINKWKTIDEYNGIINKKHINKNQIYNKHMKYLKGLVVKLGKGDIM